MEILFKTLTKSTQQRLRITLNHTTSVVQIKFNDAYSEKCFWGAENTAGKCDDNSHLYNQKNEELPRCTGIGGHVPNQLMNLLHDPYNKSNKTCKEFISKPNDIIKTLQLDKGQLLFWAMIL